MAKTDHTIVLVVLDGWGYSDATQYNAIHSAETPVWDRLWSERPHTLIRCAGPDVGLPDGQMGNSEVGHMHIGAGRVIPQELTRITQAVEDGDLAGNPVLEPVIKCAAADNRALHLMGLLSPGGVHSHEDHIAELVRVAARGGVTKIYVHAFLDGRDTPPKSAAESLQLIQMKFGEAGSGRIASIIGRYYAMDRNKRWNRTRAAYDLVVHGRALYEFTDPFLALEGAYARGETDEFVKATSIRSRQQPRVCVEDGDFVLFCNFRADRARQLSSALTVPDFDCFPRGQAPKLGGFLTMTDYGDAVDARVLFPNVELVDTFGHVAAAHGLRQLRIAETEKYAHVTFFFNGGQEQPFPREDRILIPSPRVPTYDQKPEMSAVEVTDALIEAMQSHKYDVVICNYANADMVGHTGDFEATVRCIETLDACLGRLVEAARRSGMELLITADHGNAEKMRTVATKHNPGHPHTAHTDNLVPLVYVGRSAEMAPDGSLIDVAPTMLALMGLPRPAEMTGRPLLKLCDSSQHAA